MFNAPKTFATAAQQLGALAAEFRKVNSRLALNPTVTAARAQLDNGRVGSVEGDPEFRRMIKAYVEILDAMEACPVAAMCRSTAVTLALKNYPAKFPSIADASRPAANFNPHRR